MQLEENFVRSNVFEGPCIIPFMDTEITQYHTVRVACLPINNKALSKGKDFSFAISFMSVTLLPL